MEQALTGFGDMLKSGWATTTDVVEGIGDNVTNVATSFSHLAVGAAYGNLILSLST